MELRAEGVLPGIWTFQINQDAMFRRESQIIQPLQVSVAENNYNINLDALMQKNIIFLEEPGFNCSDMFRIDFNWSLLFLFLGVEIIKSSEITISDTTSI